MKDKILTIDVGTGSTRAAILRVDGTMVGFAQREYEQTTPRAGWSEQARLYGGRPPATVYARCFTAILKRLRRLRLLAPAGRCTAPSCWTSGELVEDRALLWNDKRSQPQVDAFCAKGGKSGWRI
jgi:sugar (pentulose or hexulose) kinase